MSLVKPTIQTGVLAKDTNAYAKLNEENVLSYFG